ncbi:MAG TPA: ligase-associated DNA damage response endonuclease PdeM [Xanthobacteraceae bacterium]|nr:ligase-associated DNA damage response endonuclease PdeM [Xanthobacteraceae bacterium]
MRAAIEVAGVPLEADCAGALYWPEEELLAVSDLHFEKGSSYAARGMLLPPYDTAATLAALSGVIAQYDPRTVVTLGDSFHDNDGPSRLSASDRATLGQLQRGRDWIWIAGNHDSEMARMAREIGGVFAHTLSVGPLTFRHIPEGAEGEIAGHLHPSARISWRGRSIVRRCFAADAGRMVMPAFGAYTGGLSIRDRAFAAVFGTRDFMAHMLGGRRLYAFSAAHCL